MPNSPASSSPNTDGLDETQVVGGKLGATSIPKQRATELNVDFESNMLDMFDLPTYHFRLYMLSQSAMDGGRFGAAATKANELVVIAESGVTPIDIDNVEIMGVSSISASAGVGQVTNVSFTLREPHGATLIDQLHSASRFLDIKNFVKFPFYLELSFVGRESGDLSSPLATSNRELQSLKWTWPIHIKEVAMNVNTGGSTYAITAVPLENLGYTNQASDLEQVANIAAATVGEFFTLLQEQLNTRSDIKKETSNYIATDTYEFYIDETLYNQSIVPETVEERQNRAAAYDSDSQKMIFSFAPPMDIERIVYNVLSLTNYFQKQVKSTTDANAIVDDKAGENAIFQTLFRVIADTRYGAYDIARQDYQKHFKYLIVPFEMATLNTPSNAQASVSSQARFDALKRKGVLKKLYNYIYTGLNDQVLDFDLNFNFLWYTALPLQKGATPIARYAEPIAKLTGDQKDKGQAFADQLAKARSASQQFGANAVGFNPLSFVEDWLQQFALPDFSEVNQTVADISSNVDAAQAQANAAQVAANTAISSLTSTVQPGMPAIPETIGGVVLPPLSISNTLSTINQLTSFTRLPRVPNIDTGTVNKSQESLRELDIPLDDIRIEEKANAMFTVSLKEANDGKSSADGQGFAASAGQTFLSAMFEQASSPAKDLMQIELKIKGDPYWIEPGPGTASSSFKQELVRRTTDPNTNIMLATGGGTATNFTSLNSTNAETLIVFRSFTPLEYNPITGITPAGKKTNNAINGLYAVKKVTHSFQAGVFTQTLTANRELHINLANVDLDANLTDQPEDAADRSTYGPRTDVATVADGAGAANITQGIPTLTESLNTTTALIRPNPIGPGASIFDSDSDLGGNPPNLFNSGSN